MARPRQIARLRLRIDRDLHRPRPILRRNARRRSFAGVNRHGERGVAMRRVIRHLERDLEIAEALGREREANQSAPVLRHEVDRRRRHRRRRHRQIAFVLSILIVNDDDHAAGFDRDESFFDRRKRRGRTTAFGEA